MYPIHVFPSLTALGNTEFLANHEVECTHDPCTVLCYQSRSCAEFPAGSPLNTTRITAVYTETGCNYTARPNDPEEGASTAEYGIVMLAAVGFAGLLVAILKSDEVREMLLGVIRNALSIG